MRPYDIIMPLEHRSKWQSPPRKKKNNTGTKCIREISLIPIIINKNITTFPNYLHQNEQSKMWQSNLSPKQVSWQLINYLMRWSCVKPTSRYKTNSLWYKGEPVYLVLNYNTARKNDNKKQHNIFCESRQRTWTDQDGWIPTKCSSTYNWALWLTLSNY